MTYAYIANFEYFMLNSKGIFIGQILFYNEYLLLLLNSYYRYSRLA